MTNDPTNDPMWEFFGEPIHSYTRAQALADGVLVDVTAWAKDLFKIPVAVTVELWGKIESIPESRAGAETAEGRTREILKAAVEASRRASSARDRVRFAASLTVRGGLATLDLLAHCGPGDRGEPVVTVGFPSDF